LVLRLSLKEKNMRFTVNRLISTLVKLRDQGHGRKLVCVSKTTFIHNCESDGVTILEVAGVGLKSVTNSDGYGNTKWNKDGTVSCRFCVVLAGDGGANIKGELIDE
jgi:RNA-splicing ligase RtcB